MKSAIIITILGVAFVGACSVAVIQTQAARDIARDRDAEVAKLAGYKKDIQIEFRMFSNEINGLRRESGALTQKLTTSEAETDERGAIIAERNRTIVERDATIAAMQKGPKMMLGVMDSLSDAIYKRIDGMNKYSIVEMNKVSTDCRALIREVRSRYPDKTMMQKAIDDFSASGG